MQVEQENLKKYLKKKYYKDDHKIVVLSINEESELYNHLDKMNDTLNTEVTEYLNRSVEALLPLNKIKIKIECPKKIDLKNFQRCLKVHYGIENLNYRRIKRLEKRKKYILLLIALVTMLSFYLDYTTLLEVRNFIITLSIWEYADMLLGHDEEDDIKEYVSTILEDAEIEK